MNNFKPSHGTVFDEIRGDIVFRVDKQVVITGEYALRIRCTCSLLAYGK